MWFDYYSRKCSLPSFVSIIVCGFWSTFYGFVCYWTKRYKILSGMVYYYDTNKERYFYPALVWKQVSLYSIQDQMRMCLFFFGDRVEVQTTFLAFCWNHYPICCILLNLILLSHLVTSPKLLHLPANRNPPCMFVPLSVSKTVSPNLSVLFVLHTS